MAEDSLRALRSALNPVLSTWCRLPAPALTAERIVQSNIRNSQKSAEKPILLACLACDSLGENLLRPAAVSSGHPAHIVRAPRNRLSTLHCPPFSCRAKSKSWHRCLPTIAARKMKACWHQSPKDCTQPHIQ